MNKPEQTKIVSSVLWSIASRWGSKAIGMVNIIVLARLLSPEDFGIVAMATIVLGVVDSMTQVGIHLYVIRQAQNDERIYHSAWTVGLIQAGVIASLLALSAPWIASFYSEEALINIVYCLAITRLIKGLQNFGIYIAQKQLKFNLDFKITILSRLAYLVSTISFAFWLQNYWAIIWGQMSAAIVAVLISYRLHPFRPTFSLYGWRKMFQFSKSTIPMSIGRFINNQLDVAVIGRVAPTEFLGQYHVASNLGNLFTKQLLAPIIRGLVPNLSLLKESPDFKDFLRLTISCAVYLFLPIGFGLSSIAPEFVHLLLGPKWLEVAPILSWLSLYAMTTGLMMFISEQFLIILSQESLSNRLMWLRNIVLISTISLTLAFSTYQNLPLAIFCSAAVTLPLIIFIVCYKIQVSVTYFIAPWWPGIIATLIMFLSLKNIPWPDWHFSILLAAKLFYATTTYLISLAVITIIRRPKNEKVPETLIIGKLNSILRRQS